jgi:hypothetical protein
MILQPLLFYFDDCLGRRVWCKKTNHICRKGILCDMKQNYVMSNEAEGITDLLLLVTKVADS